MLCRRIQRSGSRKSLQHHITTRITGAVERSDDSQSFVVGAIAFLIAGGLKENVVYFLTPTELLARGAEVVDQLRRGPGHVADVAEAPHRAVLIPGDSDPLAGILCENPYG